MTADGSAVPMKERVPYMKGSLWAKKKLICRLLALTAVLAVLTGCSKSPSGNGGVQPVPGNATPYTPLGSEEFGDVVARNSRFTLLMAPDTCALRVRDNVTGVFWDSNPTEEELVAISSEEVQNTYRSQVILQYYNKRENLTTRESYRDAVVKEQTEKFSIENGVRVVYSMGQMNTFVYPEAISSSTMTQLEQKLDADAYARVLRFFDRIEIGELTESLREEYKKAYPLLASEPLYLARKVHANIQNELIGYFQEAGLDNEWVYTEYDKIGIAYEEVKDDVFRVTVDYRLTDSGLQAQLYTASIEYDTTQYKLTAAQLLPYFGSAAENDEGYMVIPDGSGALIDLSQHSDQTVTLPVYGEDFTSMEFQEDFYGRTVRMPVYGMQRNGSGFIAVIDSGAEAAQLNCQPGGTVYPQDTVYPSFTLCERSALKTVEAGAYSRVVYASQSYDRPLTVTYHLLADNTSGYVGMAKALREQIFAGKTTRTGEAASLFLETIGVVNRQERFLSYKVERDRALTTFPDATKLLKELYDRDVGSIQMIFENWQGDANELTLGSGNSPASVLGGRSALNTLRTTLKEGSSLYLGYDPVKRKKQTFGGRQSVLTINGKIWSYGGNLTSTNTILLNPVSIVKTMDGVLSSAKKQQVQGVYLANIGNILYSDGNESAFYNRTDMAEHLVEQVKRLPAETKRMMDVGAWYLFDQADCFIGVPTTNSGLYIECESVPLMQLVLHGYVRYTGGSLNMANDMQTDLLRAVEYGCDPQFTLTSASPQMLKNTEYSSLFSTHYANWLDTIGKTWSRLKPICEQWQGQRMSGHYSPEEGVYVTTYETGLRTIVNYTDAPVTYEGITVGAKDFGCLSVR